MAYRTRRNRKQTQKQKRKQKKLKTRRVRRQRGGMDPKPINSSSNTKLSMTSNDPTTAANANSIPDPSITWNHIQDILDQLVEAFRTEEGLEDYEYGEVLEEMDHDETVSEIVKRLKNDYTPEQLAVGMKYGQDNEGYTMFTYFIQDHTN